MFSETMLASVVATTVKHAMFACYLLCDCTVNVKFNIKCANTSSSCCSKNLLHNVHPKCIFYTCRQDIAATCMYKMP